VAEEDFEDDDDIIWLDDDIISWNWLVVCCWPPKLEKVRLLPLFYDKKKRGMCKVLGFGGFETTCNYFKYEYARKVKEKFCFFYAFKLRA
jgi:hypothetical protein